MSIFGFSTEPTSGDFLGIIKYDARAGRIFRIDRTSDGREPIDITDSFAAVFDLENVETGWLNFSGPQPDFKLVKMGQTLPVRPSENHKNGVRLMLKLHPSCAGQDKPIREFSTSAKAALHGLEKLFLEFKEKQPESGKLPIVAMQGSTPIRTGTGDRQSTNYVPKFAIVGWANRPSDLVYIPRGNSGPSQNALPLTPPHQGAVPAGYGNAPNVATRQGQTPNGTGPHIHPGPAAAGWNGGDWGSTPPTTGSQRMQPPLQQALKASAAPAADVARQAPAQPANLADDFG